MPRLRPLVAALVAVLAVSPLAAQPGASAPPPCSGAEHRQFDFWLGDWDVEANGRIAGRNRITRLFGDCGVREEYVGARGGYVGSSFNLWDASRGVWHQTWVDNQGLLLLIEGRFEGGRMVLSGRLSDGAGGSSLERITWTPSADGTLRQHWESSKDDGASWTTVFDGLYRPHLEAPASGDSGPPPTDPAPGA